MGKKKGTGIYTGVVTLALAGVIGLGAYKWDNIKPALMETKIYTQEDMDNQIKNEGQGNENCYAVIYLNEGTYLESQVIEAGSISEYTGETPTKDHYRFLGWSLDGETVIDTSEVPITNNTTYHAVFEQLTLDNTSFEELLEKGYVAISEAGVVSATTTFSKLGSGTLTIEGHSEIISLNGFRSLTNITKLDISKTNIATIEGGACMSSKGIKEVLLPETLRTIKSSAFSNCIALTNIILPEGLEIIEFSAFSGCSVLSHIKLPSTLTTIGSQAFSNCNLKTLWIPQSVITIDASTNCGICNNSSGLIFEGFYTDATEVPAGWSSWWHYVNAESMEVTTNVNLNYTYEQYLEAIGE